MAAFGAIGVAAASGLKRSEAGATRSASSAPRWRRIVVHSLQAVGVTVLPAMLLDLRPLVASTRATNAMAGAPGVTVTDSTTRIELRPTGTERTTGLVLYSDALVDPRSYVPILTSLAVAGYPVVILELPFNIAFFDRSGADAVMSAEPGVTRWVVGGHSLGGVVASSVAGGADPRLRGLLLRASYPNSSIAAKTLLAVTSISGSNDGLATPAEIDDAKAKLPPDPNYVEIQGGIHSFLGDYGQQDGDGQATISREDAQRQIQSASLALMLRVEALSGP